MEDSHLKRIILTGGGTAGHVTPNIALLPSLKENGFEVIYIGSHEGIEKKLIENLGITYFGISTGKLRRYFDVKNFTDPFRIIKGYSQALSLIKKIKPDIIFSKGGFVSVPVVIAAKRRKVPCIIHESDMTPGLANKISIPFTDKVCVNFPETLDHIPKEKAVLTGTPIRKELFAGNKIIGLEFCSFSLNKPVILVMGGSSGAKTVNEKVRETLPNLLEKFQVIHLCGKGKMDPEYNNIEGYVQFEYINKELSNLFATCDIVISRAGANAICELLALRKPNILIPLTLDASRGDQILNSRSFEKQGFSYVLEEENLNPSTLLEAVDHVYENREKYIDAMGTSKQNDATSTIVDLINEMLV